MKKILLLSLFMGIFFLGCSHDETTVQILRTPLLSFNFNGSSTWKADNYSFAPVSKVVVIRQTLHNQDNFLTVTRFREPGKTAQETVIN